MWQKFDGWCKAASRFKKRTFVGEGRFFVRKTVENRRVLKKTVDNNEKYPYKMLKEVLENVIKFIFLFLFINEILSRRKELWTNFSKFLSMAQL